MFDTATVRNVLKRGVEAGDVPGVIAAAANAKGSLFAAAFGKRDLATGATMTTDTMVRIASMTKAVASTCAMQLVEQGLLEVDGPISSVLPELASVQVLDGFDSSGKAKLRPPRRPVTLRHLLTHTSG